MTIKAAINLNQEGNRLVFAGRGYQPDCDFPKGAVIGEEILPASNHWLLVETSEGKKLKISHGDYTEE